MFIVTEYAALNTGHTFACFHLLGNILFQVTYLIILNRGSLGA